MNMKSIAAILFTSAIAFASSAEDPYRAASTVDQDVSKFFEKAASADKLEVESGRLAARTASDPALKEFGQKMVSDHAKSSQELRALAAKKGVALPSEMTEADQKKLDALREEKPGKDFDSRFREIMVESHEDAVSLFDDTARDAKDAEVKAFAAKTLPKLRQHEAEAKSLPKI